MHHINWHSYIWRTDITKIANNFFWLTFAFSFLRICGYKSGSVGKNPQNSVWLDWLSAWPNIAAPSFMAHVSTLETWNWVLLHFTLCLKPWFELLQTNWINESFPQKRIRWKLQNCRIEPGQKFCVRSQHQILSRWNVRFERHGTIKIYALLVMEKRWGKRRLIFSAPYPRRYNLQIKITSKSGSYGPCLRVS